MKSNIAKRGICIIAVSVLAACAQFGTQAPLEEPTAYSLPDGKSASLIQDGWWLQLKDNKLNQLIAQAIQTSTDLRIAKARFEQAQTQLGITEAAGKTQIGMSASGFGMYVAPKPASSRIDTDHTLLLANAAVQGSWTFDFWGKNREQIAAVLGRRQAILYEAHQARIELANAVAKQYFIWQALNERQALVQERINLSEKMQQLVSRRIHANLMPAQSLYPIELAHQQLQLEKTSLEQQIAKVRHALAVLSGKVPGALSEQEPSRMGVVPVVPVNKIHADLLVARPDIAAQKSLLESKLHTVKSTEAEFYPNIELKALAGLGHIDAFNVVRGKTSGMLGIVPAINLPIFTSGALQSKLAGKRAEYNEQVAVYDQTVLNAMRSAADAVVDYQSLQSKQSTWDKMLKISEKSVKNAQGRVRAGLDNGLNALQKQDDMLQVKMQLVQYQSERLIAWSNLNAQLGGGFKTQ